MVLTLAVALALTRLATAHVLGTGVPRLRCGTQAPTEEHLAAAAHFAEQETDEGLGFRAENITVNTYFHVVAPSDREEDGYLSEDTLNEQISVMNDDFAPSGFQFALVNTTHTINEDWARRSFEPDNETAMKSALRQGTYADLNIYFVTQLDEMLGSCTFPTSSPSDHNLLVDGCSVEASTAPGGSGPYGLGKTATHETGHWMGLFHTFQGGCSEPGDEVADTPPSASASSGCPVDRDSCPGDGPDPVHNYMDYSDDACYENFTPGQMMRMLTSWHAYRA